MNIVFKQEQVYAVSELVGLSQASVRKVMDAYVSRLRGRILNGETVRFLNICYITCGSNRGRYHETLAYVSSEIGEETKLGKETVLRILLSLEELIITDLRKFYAYTIWGLVKIKCEEYRPNVYKVRVKKSTAFSQMDVRVITLNSFRRKVEEGWKEKLIE